MPRAGLPGSGYLNKKERINLIRELESELAYGRFVHTLGVSGTASALAMCYGEELDKAELAGLLHDCAKCMNLSKMLKICEKAGVDLSDLEKKSVQGGSCSCQRQVRSERRRCPERDPVSYDRAPGHESSGKDRICGRLH